MKAVPWLIAAAGCATVSGVLGGVKYLQYKEAMALMESFPPPFNAISVVEAKKDFWQPTRILGGSVRSPEHLVVSAETSGRIVELPFPSGEIVPKGATILSLFEDDIEAQRKSLVAEAKLVAVQLRRNRTLEANSMVSQDQVDTLNAKFQSLEAQVAVLDARLSKMIVLAPFEGTLGIYRQRPGDLMQAGEVLTTLVGTSPKRWIDFKVPQGLAILKVGDTVTIRSIAGSVIDIAKVIAVSEALTSRTRTYDVRASLESATLKHGELVQVIISVSDNMELISVPSRSVRWDPSGAIVFAVEQSEKGAFLPNRASVRRVEVVGERLGRMFIQGPIAPGQVIANKGAFKLRDGVLVDVKGGSSST